MNHILSVQASNSEGEIGYYLNALFNFRKFSTLFLNELIKWPTIEALHRDEAEQPELDGQPARARDALRPNELLRAALELARDERRADALFERGDVLVGARHVAIDVVRHPAGERKPTRAHRLGRHPLDRHRIQALVGRPFANRAGDHHGRRREGA